MLKKNSLSAPTASVAILEWKTERGSKVLILQRAISNKDPWSGQLALPGGRLEEKDIDLLDTAIRETEEECGILLSREQLVAELPWAIAGRAVDRNVVVAPWHFCVDTELQVSLDPVEMSRYFWLDVAEFSQIERHTYFRPLGLKKQMPCYILENQPLWGFTYGVLCRLFQVATLPDVS